MYFAILDANQSKFQPYRSDFWQIWTRFIPDWQSSTPPLPQPPSQRLRRRHSSFSRDPLLFVFGGSLEKYLCKSVWCPHGIHTQKARQTHRYKSLFPLLPTSYFFLCHIISDVLILFLVQPLSSPLEFNIVTQWILGTVLLNSTTPVITLENK